MDQLSSQSAGEHISVPSFDRLPHLFWNLLPGCIAEWMSHQWSEYIGVSAGALLGLQWLRHVHPEERHLWFDAVHTDNGRKSIEFTCRIRGADERYRWFLVQGTRSFGLPNELEQWSGSCTEVEALLRARYHATAIADLAHSLTDLQNDSEIITSAAATITDTIADWCSIELFDEDLNVATQVTSPVDFDIRQSINDMQGTRGHNADPSSLLDAARSKMEAELSARALKSADEGASLLKSTIRSIAATPIHNGDTIIGAIHAGSGGEKPPLQADDMQWLTRVASMIASNVKRSREIVLLKEQGCQMERYIALLGHELRTPLTAVTAALEFVASENLPAGIVTALDVARRNVELETSLLNNLLEATRMRSDRLRLEITMLDLHSLLLDVIDVCRIGADARDLRIVTDLRAENTWVAGDETRLHQVFLNLLNNAIRYTPRGGVIEVRTSSGERTFVVKITDSGCGLVKEDLKVIRDLLECRLDRWPTLSAGLGLGLSICASIVRHHHGTMQVHSDGPDCGTTFVATLPVIDMGTFQEQSLTVDGSSR